MDDGQHIEIESRQEKVLIVMGHNFRGKVDLPILNGIAFSQKKQFVDIFKLESLGPKARNTFYHFWLIRQMHPKKINSKLWYMCW